MSIAEGSKLTDVLDRVVSWPTTLRITLARKILESLDKAEALPPLPPKTRGLSAAELRGLLMTDRPPPDDETIEQWIDEHRMEKYG
jgi:hypothetical protein